MIEYDDRDQILYVPVAVKPQWAEIHRRPGAPCQLRWLAGPEHGRTKVSRRVCYPFITLLGGAAAAWPLAVRAQQTERVRRIGIIQPASSDDAEYQIRVGALLQELQQLGWIIGRNIRIETRWTKFDPEESRKYAAELVALAPDAIVATGISTVGPLLQLTRTVPIVFPAASDPVAAGLVENLARPGGNATGFFS